MTYPNISNEKLIALDIETHDPNLKELGPGVRRQKAGIEKGGILCIGIATATKEWYFPANDYTYNWLKDNDKIDIVTANGMYDCDFLQYEGYLPKGKIFDIQIAEPLIYEHSESFSLDTLAKKYLNVGKETSEIDEWCYMNNLKGDSRQHLAKMPFDLVGKYCAMDCRRTYDVFQKQLPILKQLELEKVFDLETRLLKVLLYMRKIGVRIDENKLGQAIPETRQKVAEKQAALNRFAGFDLNVNSAKQIQVLFDQHGKRYSRNQPTEAMKKKGIEQGNPCFDSAFLKICPWDVAQDILEIRQLEKLDSTFLTGLDRFVVDGRIHPLFHSLRNDEYGTISGRFSGSLPNFQQLPSRNKTMKKIVRGMVIPEDGCDFFKLDYSSIEYRAFAMYASGKGSEEIREAYRLDPMLDYHSLTAAIIFNCRPDEVTKEQRSRAKTINFGILFGMGATKLSNSLGLELDEGYKFLNEYHNKLPFVKSTMADVSSVFKSRGYIKSKIGRRFNYLDKDYVGVNRLTQSFGADLIKTAMVNSYEQGLFDILHVPLTVHDELSGSVPRTSEGRQALEQLKINMESALPCSIPLVAELGIGDSWATVE